MSSVVVNLVIRNLRDTCDSAISRVFFTPSFMLWYKKGMNIF